MHAVIRFIDVALRMSVYVQQKCRLINPSWLDRCNSSSSELQQDAQSAVIAL